MIWQRARGEGEHEPLGHVEGNGKRGPYITIVNGRSELKRKAPVHRRGARTGDEDGDGCNFPGH